MLKRFCVSGLSELAAALFFASSGAHAATLNVVDGQLLGASGVDVVGTLYDVEFRDGTCIALFSGCNSAADFTFDFRTASLASQALLDQVFLDGGFGAFDTTPEISVGCTDTSMCIIGTPHGLSDLYVLVIAAFNLSDANDLGATTGALFTTIDTTQEPAFAFAVWIPVPEPCTGLLMVLGLLLTGVRMRRNRTRLRLR
ncbi:MAG: PEP-CTERM sorting domain-containing protein [Myxococcales bacterium]|nr:PEP-CTERM sorting domain-containing protein [Myxococcales bacterium]